jgi:hypothetical protein
MRTDENGGRLYLVYFHTKLLDFRCAYASLSFLPSSPSLSFSFFLLSLSRVKLVPLNFRGKLTPREKFVLIWFTFVSL